MCEPVCRHWHLGEIQLKKIYMEGHVNYGLFVNWFQLNLPPQTTKHFHICKRINFAILTFVIIKEMASVQQTAAVTG